MKPTTTTSDAREPGFAQVDRRVRLNWSRTDRGDYVAPLGGGKDAGHVEFRVSHDPTGMNWQMEGRLYGRSSTPINLLRRVPDNGAISLTTVLEIFKRACESTAAG